MSTNAEKVREFGIDPANMFGFWDWVGGRYSMDSAIGLSLMVAIGPDAFRELLAGFHAMDEHFRTAPLERNLPGAAGLLGVWYANFFGAQTHAVLPYSHYLRGSPPTCSSSTWSPTASRSRPTARRSTTTPARSSGATPGTNGQHAFYQLLHQGTRLVPADFIGFANPRPRTIGDHHDLLMANFFAQTEALAFGKTPEEVAAEGVPAAPGRRPHVPRATARRRRSSPTELTPADRSAQLVALYEHKVFVQGVIWGIDSFDQWGVELGKALATRIAPELTAGTAVVAADHDGSTMALVERYRALRMRGA